MKGRITQRGFIVGVALAVIWMFGSFRKPSVQRNLILSQGRGVYDPERDVGI